jgi:preprotein translocase subunit SecF
MEEQKHEHPGAEHHEHHETKSWFDRNYKLMMIIPILIVIASLFYIGNFYVNNNDVILKDISLSGGTSITLNDERIDYSSLESQLKEKYADIDFRRLTDMRTGKEIAFVIQVNAEPDKIKADIEQISGVQLTEENSSTEFTGSGLSDNFFKQLMLALIVAFILMSIVIFVLFRTFIPSIAVIFAAFSDIVMPLAVLDMMGIKVSAAGIAAFLMLIGYSVDTDILLTTRAIKIREGTLNSRIFGAFKTGIFMTSTALCAVLPAFFIVTGLPDSFRQIFLILSLGLVADIINTWTTNVGIIKWYCSKKGIN